MEPQEIPQTSPEPKKTNKFIIILLVVILVLGLGYMIYTNLDNEKIEDKTLVGVDYSILGVKYDDFGPYFVRAESLQVLYTTADDCIGACLDEWVPYEAVDTVVLGNIFTEEREDNGALQYTWKGKRLYTYTKDTLEDNFGDGVGGVWSIVRP